MSGTHMYGVVLWINPIGKKAVIWCEDHGKLAFYSSEDQSAMDGMYLDAGDLIQFDMKEESDMRLAHNPQLVRQSQFVGIAQSLSHRGGPVVEKERCDPRSNVIPLKRDLKAHKLAV
ncbi:MAG: hypothetical protein ACKVKF_14380 [Rhodobacterales bacterium]|nr:hypothetical protein [Puniceibacterium antarcticum]